jgi:hypothetical protein
LSSRVVPLHCPFKQASFWVHVEPSLHVVPSGLSFVTHPSTTSHDVTVHGLRDARHVTGLLTEHDPLPLHASPVVQAFESLQLVPAGFGGFEHTPVAGAQVPML